MSTLEHIVVFKLNDKRLLPTLPKAFQADNQKTLGSTFKPGSRDVVRGLTPDLERIILPNYIGAQPSDVQFAHRSRGFWADFTYTPDAKGVRLNIATEKKQVKGHDGAMVEVEYPVNPDDYMLYQIAYQSPKTAKTEAERSNLEKYDFILEDLKEVEEKSRKEFQAVENADLTFAKLITMFDEQRDKIEMIVELLRDKTEALTVEALDTTALKMHLRKIKETQPLKFVDAVNDPELESKAFILKAYHYKIISKEGSDYFFGEENIGAGKVAVSWFKKPENSQKVVVIRARLKQAIETRKS